MTDDVKVIPIPKVRFHQFSDDAQNVEENVKHDGKERAVVRANGPRIKEIISLKRPIRIVDLTKQSTSVTDQDISASNCNIDASSRYRTTSDDTRNMSLSERNVPKVEDMCQTMTLRDANVIQNTKKNCKISQFDNKSLQDNVLKDRAKNLRQKGKENEGISLARATSSKNISETRTKNSQHVQSFTRKKFKMSADTKSNCMRKVNVSDSKRPKMTKSQSTPNIMKKTRNSMMEGKMFNAKPPTSHVASHCRTVGKNQISPVKKIVLRNVKGPMIKTSIGPGVFHKEQTTMTSDANERHVKLDAVQDLEQPKYNSIMHTINKLKELEQQKIVTDISHFPSALKTFLNGKISAALDFPLDEAVYKNLVDLSIDEKQLPSTILRSKDPKPRQKDIIPKLADFFVPENTKEICEAVHVKSQAPKINDNWNAFKISDRILEWKYSIDGYKMQKKYQLNIIARQREYT
ncbi:uncharacterized protein LOC105206519 [Solenopsis invicta]|uniref:uncharacterized protein LOC105206519 n=1 Tax=Solenopsis invicta TaxID=13686 RepID=UPI00193D2582|nr:uncharacterized protein LOC105206519 [Solenopsis invicta]